MFHLKKKQTRKIFLKPGTTDMRKSVGSGEWVIGVIAQGYKGHFDKLNTSLDPLRPV